MSVDSDLKKAEQFINELKGRGLIHQHTWESELISLLASGKRTYMGIDPTSDFLHLGHYVGLSLLKRFIKQGYPVVILIGSFTAKIGDPSFRSKTRKFNANIEQNARDIKAQLVRLFSKEIEKKIEDIPLCEIVDNYELHNSRFVGDAVLQHQPLNLLVQFINEVCSSLKVSELIKRDFLADRLGSGLTLSEFLYPGLQGWDFLHLYKSKNVAIQIGGSDQWGNMLTGLQLIVSEMLNEKNIEDSICREAGVITIPLITDAFGNKFGKSEGNAISINSTSEVKNEYYVRQYFLNSPDELVRGYLLKFTYLETIEIDELIAQGIKIAKSKLADLVCREIFGDERTFELSAVAEELFSGLIKQKTYEDLLSFGKWLPTGDCYWRDGLQLSSVFEILGLVSSKSEFNRLIASRGIYVMGLSQEDLVKEGYRLQTHHVTWKDESQDRGVIVVRKGKKQYGVMHFTREISVFEQD